MNILIISDWHGKNYDVPKVGIDLLICLGDFSWEQITKLDKEYNCIKLGLLGNHDRWDTYKGTSFTNMHSTKIDFNGITFAGFGGCPRYTIKDTPQYEEEDVEDFLKTLGHVDVFLSHSNPMLKPNFDRSDAHRGFMAMTSYITKFKPDFFIHGHEHIDKEELYERTNIISVYPYKIIYL